MNEEWFQIEKTFLTGAPIDGDYIPFFSSIEKILFHVAKKQGAPTLLNRDKAINSLIQALPIVDSHQGNPPLGPISVYAVTTAQYSHGLGRFFSDICSRWLIPGSFVPIVIIRSLNFKFTHGSGPRCFITEVTVAPSNEEESRTILKNLPNLTTEVLLTLNTVEYARKLSTSKILSSQEKGVMLKDNFAALTHKSQRNYDTDIFDQMHTLLVSASSEEHMKGVRSLFNPLIKKRPEVFKPDLFKEFRRFILNIPEQFMGLRKLRHISRIVCYQYFFRQTILDLCKEDPKTRHLSIKLMQTTLSGQKHPFPILGIVLVLSHINESEVFEDKHLLGILKNLIEGIQLVPRSYFYDDRPSDNIQSLYLEIQKKDRSRFSIEELKHLKKNLPREIDNRVEEVYQPLFVHRNEEETMRSIVDLSNQLKYVHDIPQVTVSFHQQTRQTLSFTITLVRLQKTDSRSIRDILSSAQDQDLKFNDLDVKVVGLLRRRYPKEAAVFEIVIPKTPYIREDYTVDFYKARSDALSILQNLFGEVRDYNGGMISKQTEVLDAVKKILAAQDIQNDYLLENFFYSLTPRYMQSLLPPQTVEKLFILFSKALDLDYAYSPFSLLKETNSGYTMYMLSSPKHDFIEAMKKHIELTEISSELTTGFHSFYDVTTLGIIINSHFKDDSAKLETIIHSFTNEWNFDREKLKLT